MRHTETFYLLDELKKVKFSEDQAKMVLEVVESSRNTGLENLATKQDISDLRLEISAVRFELKEDMANLRTELKEDIANLRTELKEDIANLRTELKADIANLRTELKADIAALKGEFKTIYWIGGAGFTLLSAIAIKIFLG